MLCAVLSHEGGDGKAFRLEGVLIIKSMGKGTSNWFV